MSPKRIEWRAEDGIPPAQAGWYRQCGGPLVGGIWTDTGAGKSLYYNIPQNGQRYCFYLPETLRSHAAMEVDITIGGFNNDMESPTFSAWLPGETTTAYHGASSLIFQVSTTTYHNGPDFMPTPVDPEQRTRLRLERRGEEVFTYIDGTPHRESTTFQNAKASSLLHDFPQEALQESCVILAMPPQNTHQYIWLYRMLWEEL